MTGSWNDLCRRLDGVALARLVGTSVEVTTGTGEVLWSRTIGVARNVSVAADDKGDVLVAFTRQESDKKDHAIVVGETGPEIDHGAIIGTLRPLALRWRLARFVLTVAEALHFWSLRDALTKAIIRRDEDAAWATGGFVDVREDGSPIWAYVGKPPLHRDGIDFPVTSGKWTAGQGNDPSQALISDGQIVGTLLVGEAREVRVVELPDGSAAVAARVEGGYGVFFDVIDTVPPLHVPEVVFKPSDHFLCLLTFGEPNPRYSLLGATASDTDMNSARRGVFVTVDRDDMAPKITQALKHGLPIYGYHDVQGEWSDNAEIDCKNAEDHGCTVVRVVNAYPKGKGANVEPLDVTAARVEATVARLRSQGHRVALCVAVYRQIGGDLTSFSWTEAQVVGMLQRAWAIALRHRCVAVLPFAWSRAEGKDGLVAHAGIRDAYAKLSAAIRGAETWPLKTPQPEPDPAPDDSTPTPDPSPETPAEDEDDMLHSPDKFNADLKTAAPLLAEFNGWDPNDPARLEEAEQGAREIGDKIRSAGRNPSAFELGAGVYMRSGGPKLTDERLREWMPRFNQLQEVLRRP